MRGVFIYDKPESSNGGVFKIYDEPHRSGVFKVYDSRKACLNIYDEPASPNRGPCLRSMIAGNAK